MNKIYNTVIMLPDQVYSHLKATEGQRFAVQNPIKRMKSKWMLLIAKAYPYYV
jgi:hypothetical protein